MQPGDVIDGKYEVELLLGEGGMGRVVAATHRVLGTTVAIKALKPDGARIPEVAKRFMREARAASRLRSEHVAQVMDVGQLQTGEPYMVMQMLHGADLASILKQGPIAPGIAADYIIQACEGLAEAHGMGMVHRDIKPANLFLTQRPNGEPLVKVLDFGIATAAHGELDRSLTMTNMVMGSPNYMSPEQLRSTRSVDARSDIWSLGVTLYEMLAGRNPFEGTTFTALTIMIATEPHQSLSVVAPELAAVVDRCLAKEPEHRFGNVAELAGALAPFAERAPDRSAVDRMLGALKSAVPPTLHPGMVTSGAVPSALGSGHVPARGSSPSRVSGWNPPQVVYAPGNTTPAPTAWTPGVPVPGPSPTTSQLISGQSSVETAPRAQKSRLPLIILGGLVLGAAAAAAVAVLMRPADDVVVASAPRPPVKEQLKVEPIEPPPKPEPAKAEPAKPAIEQPAKPDPAAHVRAAEELFAKGKPDAAVDELAQLDDITGLDVSVVAPYIDKLRRKTTNDKIKKLVALLALPPLKPAGHPHVAPPHKDPPHKEPAPPTKEPAPPTKTPCAPSDPKCGL